MIKEQIDKLKTFLSRMDFDSKNGGIMPINIYDCATVSGAIKTIQELSAKLHAASMERSSQYYNGGRIPCEERMPEQSGKYWVTALCGRNLKTITATYSPRYGRFTPTSTKAYNWKIIAWMPLPAPYQLKESEEDND